jgi:hypothetical protein
MTFPPPISLVSLGISPFCGSLLFTEITGLLEPLAPDRASVDDDPHAATDNSMAPAAAPTTNLPKKRVLIPFLSLSVDHDIHSAILRRRYDVYRAPAAGSARGIADANRARIPAAARTRTADTDAAV